MPLGAFLLCLSCTKPSLRTLLTFKNEKEETTMVMKKSITIWGFVVLIVIWAWLVGFPTPVDAETLKFKGYTFVDKSERVLIGDVQGHSLSLTVRRSILVFENGDTATVIGVSTSDTTKGSGPFLMYNTFTFADGSTIITKTQGTIGGTAVGVYQSGGMTGEIIKGTGRFEGIKGTSTSAYKFFPLEKGEIGPKGIGEGALTFTLPSK
jgi:hypothetical protein